MKIYVDGGEFSKICVYTDNPEVIKLPEELTSNEMEYLALIQGLLIAEDEDIIITDSQLVMNQVKGDWKLNASHLEKYFNIAQHLYNSKDVDIHWVKRDDNKAGVYLENVKQKS